MEFFQVFSFLTIVYAFIRFLPKKGRLIASIPIISLISFSYQSGLMNDIANSFIKLLNSDIFYAQMVVCFSLAFTVQTSLSSPPLKSQGPLQFSQFRDFFNILNHSIKLVPKNGNLMGLVTTLSLLVPSILFSLFTYSYQFLLNRAINNSLPIILLCILVAEAVFLVSCSVVFQFSSMATILVSAAAYSDDNKLSASDLFSRIKRNWRRQLSNSFSRSRNPRGFELVNGAISDVIYVAAMVNITSAVMLVFFMDQTSAAWPLSSVVSVMEESSDGREAQEKAGRLVEGERSRVHGFMLKLLFLMTLLYSLILGESGHQIQLTRGLLLLNLLSLGRMLWRILHTVLYFRCLNEKGEEISGRPS